MTIPEIIRKMVMPLIQGRMPKYCKVDEVNGSLCDVTDISTDTQILDVRLQGQESDGMLLIPKVGSLVGVTMINKVQGYVSLYSDIDSIRFGDGSFDGLVKVQDLTTKLNNLENDVNELKNLISTWAPVPSDGGTALKTILATWYASSLTVTNKTELENDKITHGEF